MQWHFFTAVHNEDHSPGPTLPLSNAFVPKNPAHPMQSAPTTKGGSMFKLKKFAKLTKNQKGQGVMEYVIISSLVGIVCITAVKQFGNVIEKRVEVMKESISNNITTEVQGKK